MQEDPIWQLFTYEDLSFAMGVDVLNITYLGLAPATEGPSVPELCARACNATAACTAWTWCPFVGPTLLPTPG